MKLSVQLVAVTPPYPLFLAKIVPFIAVIVSRLSVPHAPSVMTLAITARALAAVMVVTVDATAAMVAAIGVIVAGKKTRLTSF